jgi:SAM-dependent methyltransferase
MHDTAMEFGTVFFNTYTKAANNLTIVDLGSQDVNGSLKSVTPKDNNYIGVDIVEGKAVDIVIKDIYSLPFENDSVDLVISSSCFEHSEFFWLLFNEALRFLKPAGLLYINVPSNGTFHRYPIDCWRFYPDSGIALQNWGRRSGYNVALLESFIGMQKVHQWNDFVAVFIKDGRFAPLHANRMQDSIDSFKNGHLYGIDEVLNFVEPSEDQAAHSKLTAIVQSINQILK